MSVTYKNCGYCNEPIERGIVTVARIDDKETYFHNQGCPAVLYNCYINFVFKNSKGLHARTREYDLFNKLVNEHPGKIAPREFVV